MPDPQREQSISPSPRPRVLFVCCHLPWPPASGGRRRELELITRVAEHFDVHLVVVSKTPSEDAANARFLAPVCRAIEVFPADPLPADVAELGHSIPVLRHRAPAAGARIAEILEREGIDLIHVEGFYLMQHVPEWADVPVLLVEQNVEYELDYQRGRAVHDGVTRLDSFVRGAQTREAELDCWLRATQLATVTDEDCETIRAQLPGAEVAVVPDGADHIPGVQAGVPAARVERPDGPLVVLLANFGYAPNVDAALHLCQDILPLVRAQVPHLHVWLVGNAPPADVLALGSDRVTVTGYVPDVLPYLDAADVVACPLRIGGGVKLKTIEALRRGKAIVSTSVGVQGLPGEARHALVIADEPAAFADATTHLLLDVDARSRCEREAANAASRLPTWDSAAAELGSIYDQLLDPAVDKRDAVPVVAGRFA